MAACTTSTEVGAEVAAGPDVHVIDVLGLADTVGSRIPADPDARIGHQKRLPPAHVLARLTLAREDGNLPADVDPTTLEAARWLLRQPAVVGLLAATRDPLTPERAVHTPITPPPRRPCWR